MIRSAAAWVLLVGLVVNCAPRAAALPNLGETLAGQVIVDAMLAHLQRLQDIANANGGNRADGTPGFDASAEYVAQLLRDKGFDVTTPQFTRFDTTAPGEPTLTVASGRYPVDQASLLVQTPAGGVNGPVVRPGVPAGCAAADYPGGGAAGGIAVVDDTGCSVVDKQNAAHGAAALIVVSDPGRTGARTGLFPADYYDQLTMPVAVVGAAGGTALDDASGPVNLVLDTATVKITSRNVLAQTKTGSTHDVVMVGAHLDSVAVGPGINDNGSGVAAVLETARQLGATPAVANAVRFAFWGAEEPGLGGSGEYVLGLDRDQLNDIALYLNFDMIGSPNAGFFTYTGQGQDDAPAGSAGIERVLADYLTRAGKRAGASSLGTDSDYRPFMFAGIPVGGLTTGGLESKTAEQARFWGGQADASFDPNYHSARDTVDNINRNALAITGSGVAFAVGNYAQSIDGVNGVASHDLRNRTKSLP